MGRELVTLSLREGTLNSQNHSGGRQLEGQGPVDAANNSKGTVTLDSYCLV